MTSSRTRMLTEEMHVALGHKVYRSEEGGYALCVGPVINGKVLLNHRCSWMWADLEDGSLFTTKVDALD